jgi:hypothetical protein
MDIHEIVVLTTVKRFSYARRSEIGRRAEEIYCSPTFDRAVANQVITRLLNEELLERNGETLTVTYLGIARLKNSSRGLARLQAGIDSALQGES